MPDIDDPQSDGEERLLPRDGHVTVRMYRIGHGDCFLLAFPTANPEEPTYVLIDCGYKPGSPGKIPLPEDEAAITAREVCESIRAATGGHIHVVVVTHEHQDHVNGFTEANFRDITFGQSWFAWTEDPDDDLANALRKRFKDRLLLLLDARRQLSADVGARAKVAHIDDFLAFELGGEEEWGPGDSPPSLAAAAADPSQSANKRALRLVKDRSQKGSKYLRPHTKPLALPGVNGVRVFALGPPRDEELLESMDPEGEEGFQRLAGRDSSLTRMLGAGLKGRRPGLVGDSPFAGRYAVAWPPNEANADAYWKEVYGAGRSEGRRTDNREDEIPSAPAWRRIDSDWLHASEKLALDMNDETNNGSLVLAFELGPLGKVLLFAADAQRGNWISWNRKTWKVDGGTLTAKELLARTVLYKVGHHGSHNATLDGREDSQYANLAWMGQGDFGQEFTAMITAVRPWAENQKGWDHPLPSIKSALQQKAAGRVFQTDTGVDQMPRRGSAAAWNEFRSRVRGERLYMDYDVAIEP